MTIALTVNQARHVVIPTHEPKSVKGLQEDLSSDLLYIPYSATALPRTIKTNSCSSTSVIKKVQFFPFVTSYLDITTNDEYNCPASERWYSSRDYAIFRAEAHQASDQFKTVNAKSARLLKDVMKACIRVSEQQQHQRQWQQLKQYHDDPEQREQQREVHLFYQLMQKHTRLMNGLQTILQDTPDLIGIYKHGIEYLMDDKYTRREEIEDIVVYHTMMTDHHSSSSNNNKNNDNNHIVPAVFLSHYQQQQYQKQQKQCQRISYPSRLFAQVIGHIAYQGLVLKSIQ